MAQKKYQTIPKLPPVHYKVDWYSQGGNSHFKSSVPYYKLSPQRADL